VKLQYTGENKKSKFLIKITSSCPTGPVVHLPSICPQ